MAEQTNTKLQGTARISILEIHSRAIPSRESKGDFLMDMCREKRIHLLRQSSSLLPSFSLKQRSASCATGEDTAIFHHARENSSITSSTEWPPAFGEQGENRSAGFSTGRVEMVTPGPPSWLGTSTAPHLYQGIYITESLVHLDKVASNFKATFILYAATLQFCIPGFMKQRQRKMRWQSAEICRHTCDLL